MGNTSFCDATGLPGLPANEVMNIIGHTDSGKSTLLWEIAYSAQKNDILPVFVITELKFSWEHLKIMGVEYDEVIDESTGEVTYEGDFLFIDRSQFNSIEEMGSRINEILDYQKSGELPRDLCFLVDSIGTLQSDLSLKSNKSNNEWDAGAISRVFGKSIVPRINLSKKEGYPHDNYMAIVSQVWVRKPDSPVGKPKLAAKGGDTIPFNSTIQVVFGNVTNNGTSKLKAVKNGKDVVYATRTKVNIAKNHATGVSLTTRLVATPSGFIDDSKGDVVAKKYFKDNAEKFLELLGGGSVDDVIFESDDSNLYEENLSEVEKLTEQIEDISKNEE
jgi:energy-coupling factor transporter ATP-binding protein EcfA2